MFHFPAASLATGPGVCIVRSADTAASVVNAVLRPIMRVHIALPRECHPAAFAHEITGSAVEELVHRGSAGARELRAALLAEALSEVCPEVRGHGPLRLAPLLADGTRQLLLVLFGASGLMLVDMVGHQPAGVPELQLTFTAVVDGSLAHRPNHTQSPPLLRDVTTRCGRRVRVHAVTRRALPRCQFSQRRNADREE